MSVRATEKKPKTTPMRWLKLGEAKDPEFKKSYLLFAKAGSLNEYQVGILAGIKQTETGKQYTWDIQGAEDSLSHYTHYAIINPATE